MRLHVSQGFGCVETDNVQKKRFDREIKNFSAFNAVFAEKRAQTHANACFSAS